MSGKPNESLTIPVGMLGNEHDELPEGVKAWAPVEIVYGKIDINRTTDEVVINFCETRHEPNPDIAAFLKSLRPPSSCPAPQRNGIKEEMIPETSLLDIAVHDPCYVVFELNHVLDWHFTPTIPGLKVKPRDQGQYVDLKHVDANGTSYDKNDPQHPNCKILYFGVTSVRMKSDPPNADKFSLYIRLKNSGGHYTDIIIDPDIKNEGHGV